MTDLKNPPDIIHEFNSSCDSKVSEKSTHSDIKVEELDSLCWQGHDHIFKIGSSDFEILVSSYGASLMSVKLLSGHMSEMTLNYRPDDGKSKN